MDRIDKFLKTRPSKSRRLIRVGSREVVITKEDVKKVRRYVNRECLDNIDLHTPCNTAYSRVPGEAVVKQKKDISLAMQERDIKKMLSKKKHMHTAKKNSYEWVLAECAGGDEFVNLERYNSSMHISEHAFSKDALACYYKELELMYSRPKEKTRRVTADRLDIDTPYPRREAKAIASEPFAALHRGWGLVVDKAACRYSAMDVRRGIAVQSADGGRVCAVGDNIFALVHGVVIEKPLFGETVVFHGVSVADDVASVYVSREVHMHSMSVDERILDFVVSNESIVLATKRCVILHSIQTGRSRRFRFCRLQKMALKSGSLYVLSQDILYRVDFQSPGKEIVCTGVNTFSAGSVIVVASGENVVVCGRRMYQGSLVRDVLAHQTLPIFCAATANELRVFYYKRDESTIQVRLCRRIQGLFSGMVFHEKYHWLYAHREGLLRLHV
eukprot:jgi/Antlo1/1632/2035